MSTSVQEQEAKETVETTFDPDYAQEVARTIRQQCMGNSGHRWDYGAWLVIAARDAFLTFREDPDAPGCYEYGIGFRYGKSGGGRREIYIFLTAWDLYEVKVAYTPTHGTRAWRTTTVETHTMIDCATLPDLLLDIDKRTWDPPQTA